MEKLRCGTILTARFIAYLTDEDAWFLLTDHPDGLKMKVRRAMELTNDSDSTTQNSLHMATERYDFGWSDAKAVFGSEGA